MNTSQIKNFAAQSRNILKAGVIQRIQILGFDVDGNLTKGEPTRIEIQGGATLFAGEIFDGSFYDRWMSLRHRIQEKGVKEVYEEAAYTWFNRLVAIRIMQKNGFIDPVLAYTNEQTRIPRIVAEARAGRVGKMSPADREKLRELMGDDARINEQFALLIDNFCRNNAVIFNCFGGIEEYISLLLPDNILAPGGFIDLLNHTSYITDEDFKQSELIGWLYQFYISEKKDEVFDGFKKGKKAEAEDIPAATQIFTPNWIVKYMVQNTIGRIYLDNNPWATGIKESMKYLVEPAEPTPKDAILKLESIEDYSLIDPACGSGHILIEGFSTFYKIYLSEGYSSHNAIENILKRNLVGIDIDTRAKQLATFSILMTAARIDRSFLSVPIMPRVLDMPSHIFSQPLYGLLRDFYMSDDGKLLEETAKAFELLKQADNLGSIMKFSLSPKTRKEMALRFKEWEEVDSKSPVKEILPSIALILALTKGYSAVVANPPYMGNGNMNAGVSSYVLVNYPEGKADLCTVFVLRFAELCQSKGRYAYIIPPSWMFLSTFEQIRERILASNHISSIVQLSNGAFGGDFGSTISVISKQEHYKSHASFFRVVERTFQLIDQDDLRQILEGAISNPHYRFKFSDYQRGEIHYADDGKVINYSKDQDDFGKIPGIPFAYWINDNIINAYAGKTIKSFFTGKEGVGTRDDKRFMRLFWEVSTAKIGKGEKWVLSDKAGGARKWFGNIVNVMNWENDGYEIRNFKDDNGKLISRPQNIEWLYKEGVSWGKVTASKHTFRRRYEGFAFNDAAPTLFPHYEQPSLTKVLAMLNTKVGEYLLDISGNTINATVGSVEKMPFLYEGFEDDCLVQNNITISKEDWDAHETSWDFKENELVRVYKENHGEGVFMDANRLEDIVTLYKDYWTAHFNQLHANEEELNRQFIEIYGLQDELTPYVPLDEITILQQGEISVEAGQLVWHNDVLAKQLISYAVGCMMGRYRLDRPGLHIAYPNPSAEDIAAYDFQGEPFEIDDDGIIPLLPRDCPFDDNARNRLVKFIRQIFGESFLNENLNFLEASLGRTLEDYFVKDFWKDHKKMYSNRPIYWLFSSKKGAFQCLTYMHRMNPYTAEAVRSKYLLPYIDFLKNKIGSYMDRASSLNTAERKDLDKMQKALDECLEYEEQLHDVADRQIRFDLDDGVVENYAKFGDVLAKIK